VLYRPYDDTDKDRNDKDRNTTRPYSNLEDTEIPLLQTSVHKMYVGVQVLIVEERDAT
jgi:hypothetical protein